MEEALYSGKKGFSGSTNTADSEQAVPAVTAEEVADTNAEATSADTALLMKLLQKPEM